MEWTKASRDVFPKGKCLAIFLEPSFGGYSLEITTAYFDDPADYEDGKGKGWLDWNSDKEIKVTHFMSLPVFDYELSVSTQKDFLEKFNDGIELGIVSDEALINRR